MNAHSRTPNAAVAMTLLSLATTSAAALAQTPAPNKGMDYVSIDTQADTQHNQQVLTTVSAAVGRHAWVQAGLGKSHSDQLADAHHPGIAAAGLGWTSHSWQVALNTSQRSDSRRYRQTDWGSSLDWRNDGGHVGLDITRRRSSMSGSVAVNNAPDSPSIAVPAQEWLSGTGLGAHGVAQVNGHVSVYGSVARNHYESSVRQAHPTTPGGPIASLPVLARTLLGVPAVVNLDEVALVHCALLGATYRWTKVAVSSEYQAGQLYGNGGAMRSLNLKAAIDVAPGWRVAPGLGRGTSDQGGHATFASLSAMYGW